MRIAPYLCFIVFCTTIYFFFTINNKVSALRSKENALASEINKHKEIVHILRAEWAYISNPSRIEKLFNEHKVSTSKQPDLKKNSSK